MNSRHRFIDRRSIRYPFAWLITLTVLVSIALALVSDALLMLDNARTDIRRNMTNAANAAGAAASAAVVFRNAKVAREVLQMFDAYPEIEAAALYTNEGVRLASYGNDSLLPVDAREIALATPDIGLLADTTILRVPIEVDDAPAGTVYLQARLESYWHTYLTSIATTFLVGLGAGVLALILAMRFLNRIIQPVRMLAEAANDARLRQDYIPRGIPAADNEIGDLVRNFNALLAEVEAGRKSLQRQHDELERLVTERTAELLAAKEAADEANAAKSRFLAAASHDLRQPIHAMRLFQETLSGTPLNDEQRRITDYLSLSTRNLGEILNALLDVSRLDGGVMKPHPEVVPAYALLRDIEAEFAPLALAKGLRFKFYFPNHELMLFTDAKLLYSLLRNLIDNAIKYTHSGGVLVGFRRRRGSALIQVWDTGVGIAPDHLDPIFDEYFQVGNPQRDRTQGLGLGLAIVKRVAGLLGSRISCHSRPGKGSTFEVSVPLADVTEREADDHASKPAAGIATSSPCAGIHVVVIEDDVMAALALELSLGAHGMNVTTYPSAEQALADTRSEQADFYVVDFRLPGMNGNQFLDEMEKRAKQPIKAILLTGETRQAVLDSAPSPRWKVLFKPIESAALMAEIAAQNVSRQHEPGQNS
ncbi:MAG: ATP-binding protein [Gallionellaceae bacterium]|nr:ATP-binding protein [Gallionellaceae bacterium]